MFHGTQQGKHGKPNEIKGQIDGRSVALVTFYIMALEAGTHTLTFTLTTKWGGETVVKKLKVVVRSNTQSVLEDCSFVTLCNYSLNMYKLNI